MNEIVDYKEIEKIRQKENSVTIYWWEGDLLYVEIDGEEYSGLTPEEVVQRFGTNYALMQEFRHLLQYRKDINSEQILQDNQSVKKQIIDLFMELIQENNIFEGKLSIQEIKARLEKNIDAVYIVDDSYREGVAGWYNQNSKNIYVKSKNPEDLKELILSGNIKNIIEDDLNTICHETIHALCPYGLSDRDYNGRAINEGIVQFLTDKLVTKKIRGYETSSYIYREQVGAIKNLFAIYGERVLDAFIRKDEDFSSLTSNPDIEAKLALLTYVKTEDIILALQNGGEKEKLEEMKKIKELSIAVLMNNTGIKISNIFKYGLSSLPTDLSETTLQTAMQGYFQDDGSNYYSKFDNLIRESSDKHKEIILRSLIEHNSIKGIEYFIGGFRFQRSWGNEFVAKLLLNKNNNNIEAFLDEFSGLESNGYSADEKLINIIYEGLYSQEENEDNNNLIIAKKDAISKRIDKVHPFDKGYEISSIKNWEYYEFSQDEIVVVNSDNGEIIAVIGDGVQKMLDISIAEIENEYEDIRDTRYIKQENSTEKFFLTVPDDKEKYILKAFTKRENGRYEEFELGLGRNFLDDTTEMDRKIMAGTSDVRTGSIKSTMDIMAEWDMKREMSAMKKRYNIKPLKKDNEGERND